MNKKRTTRKGAGMAKRIAARGLWVVATTALLAGCAGFPFGKTPPDTYDLTAPAARVSAPKSLHRQLLVPEPTALKTLGSNQLVIHTSPSAVQYLSKSQWSDNLTAIVQSRLIEAYENSGRFGGVGRPGDGLAIDYRILTDIRAFDISVVGAPTATVDISVRILNDRNGVVRGQKDFRVTVPISGTGNAAFVSGLDAAFDQVANEIVQWTAQAI